MHQQVWLPQKRQYRTKHHVRPKCRGGNGDPWNILTLWNDHHQAYHYLFGHRTLREAARILLRIERALRSRTSNGSAPGSP